MVHQLKCFSRHLSFSSLKTVSPEKNHSPHPQHTAPHDTGAKGSGVRADHKINKQGLPLKLFINLNIAQYTNNTIFFFFRPGRLPQKLFRQNNKLHHIPKGLIFYSGGLILFERFIIFTLSKPPLCHHFVSSPISNIKAKANLTGIFNTNDSK